jgi:hypothetical protein
MKRFGLGLVGLIAIASALDSVSLVWIVLASIPCLALMFSALPDIAE